MAAQQPERRRPRTASRASAPSPADFPRRATEGPTTGLFRTPLRLPPEPGRGVVRTADRVAGTAGEEPPAPAAVRARLAARDDVSEEGEISMEECEQEHEQLPDRLEPPPAGSVR